MITKKANQRIIIGYFIGALVVFALGVSYNKPLYYAFAALLVGMALLRKYWLMKRLKH